MNNMNHRNAVARRRQIHSGNSAQNVSSDNKSDSNEKNPLN
ncbi:hypothetical protein [Aminipila terrae]|nr:hypothetical protein [Aminipila terrae]